MTRIAFIFLGPLLSISCANKTVNNAEATEKFIEGEWNKYYEEKQKGLERVLGKMHDIVGHAVVPFDAGGTLDMYYFPNGIPGTGFATMELIKPDGTGPVLGRMGTYELVSFTKEAYDSSSNDGPFNIIQQRLNGIMTTIANYSLRNKIEQKETAEIPGDNSQPNICLLFDSYNPNGQQFKIGEKKHGLLLVMEIFKDEMDFAMKKGGEALIERLKEKGHYPYSDLNRESVLR